MFIRFGFVVTKGGGEFFETIGRQKEGGGEKLQRVHTFLRRAKEIYYFFFSSSSRVYIFSSEQR